MAKTLSPEELNALDPIRCCHTYPDGHEKFGQRCLGTKSREQLFCYMHSEGALEDMAERRFRAKRRRDVLSDKLTDGERKIKTEADVQQLTEDVINGVLCGVLNKSQAGVLGVFIPVAYKIARDMRLGNVPNTTHITINNDNRSVVVQNLPAELLDQYLTASPEEKERILIEFQRRNPEPVKVKVRAPRVVEVQTNAVDSDALPIDTKSIADISTKTDLPLTRAQVKDLFGKCMKGPTKEREQAVDGTGFGALYEVDKSFHEWRKELRAMDGCDDTVKKLVYICKKCNLESPTPQKEYCDEVTLEDVQSQEQQEQTGH